MRAEKLWGLREEQICGAGVSKAGWPFTGLRLPSQLLLGSAGLGGVHKGLGKHSWHGGFSWESTPPKAPVVGLGDSQPPGAWPHREAGTEDPGYRRRCRRKTQGKGRRALGFPLAGEGSHGEATGVELALWWALWVGVLGQEPGAGEKPKGLNAQVWDVQMAYAARGVWVLQGKAGVPLH